MKKRESNFELLRILSMLLIIIHHFSVHTNWNFTPGLYFSKVFIEFLSIGGKIGVNCFILITGYFMVTKTAKFKAVLKIWKTTLFYSISLFFIFYFFSTNNFSLTAIRISFMPVLSSSYWFVTAYICIYLFSPYMNILLNNISKPDYQKFIILQFIIFSIVATFTRTGMFINELLWGEFIYSLGAYAKLHLQFKQTTQRLSLYFFISIILTLLSIVVLDYLSSYFHLISGKEHFVFSNSQGFFPLISSALLFLIFKQINIGSIYWINTIAPTMFSVYLIHDNFFIRPLLWRYVKTFVNDNPTSILIVGLIASLVILILFSLIDLLRIKISNYTIKFFGTKKNKINV
ncbi:acyltransferase [Latilactobacillus curvatus]